MKLVGKGSREHFRSPPEPPLRSSPGKNLAHTSLLARATLAACAALAVPLSGCAAVTRMNIRAEREYANEDPNPDVILDRLRDCEAVLALTSELLNNTPYSQGDPWIREIGLENNEASQLKERLAALPPYTKGEHEIPSAKLYRTHIELVVRRARWTRNAKPAVYPSILDALDRLSLGAPSLKAAWSAFQAAASARFADNLLKGEGRSKDPFQEDQGDVEQALRALEKAANALTHAELRDEDSRTLANDALTVVSMALRATLDAYGLLSTVAIQARRANKIAARDLEIIVGAKPKIPLPGVPEYAEIVERAADSESDAVEIIADALTHLAKTPLHKTAGWKVTENIIEQGIGIDLDSIRMRLRGDAEVISFDQIGARDAALEGYRGYTRRIAYDARPVAFVGSRLIVTFDWLHVKNVARINGGFATDRLWSTGGNINESASFGPQIGLTAFRSDLYDVGLDLMGVRTKVKVISFNSGELSEIKVDPATGADIGTIHKAPLSLAFRQLDVGYDISFLNPELADKYWMEDFLVGFRYMSYRIPSVLRELEDADPSPDVASSAFSHERPPDDFQTDYFMGGVATRIGQGDYRAISLFADIGLYGGAGPTSLGFLRPRRGDVDAPIGRPRSQTAIVVNASTALGVRLRLTPRRMRVRFLCELHYHADFLGQTLLSEATETRTSDGVIYKLGRRVDMGGIDVFHGPRLEFAGIF